MNRLEQDAYDSLKWHEHQAVERARWARAQPAKIVGTWAPTITEQERREREQQIAAGLIPF